MRIGSLFSGYGGLDMAAHQHFGGDVVWHAETDPHASIVLAHHYPDTPNLGDVTTIEWSVLEPIDILVGGFPCQNISSSGLKTGIKKGNRSGLWFAYAAAIRVLRPRLVFVENVRNLRERGLDIVLGDLAALGYDAQWCCVRASDVGAPQRRDRMFITAQPAPHSDGGRLEGRPWAPLGWDALRPEVGDDLHRRSPVAWGSYTAAVRRWETILGRPAPAPTDARGRPSPWLAEWMMGLPEGWVCDLVPQRTYALRVLGNGVVPQQAVLALEILT